MSTHPVLRSLSPGLLPLALAACINAGPAVATQSTSPSIGVDLGGAPARVAAPQMASMSTPMAGHSHVAKPVQAGEIQMVHEGHAGAHGTGTVNVVNVAQRKIGMRHEPIPELGWPAMTMEFAVAPSVNIQALQPGARINFTLQKGADGMYVIQSVQPAGGGR